MLYTVYILFSQNHNKIYIGFTSNLIKRFHSHNIRSRKDWTHNFRPWIVIYYEYFDIKTEAVAREKQLKGAKGREWIWDKIELQLNVKGFFSALRRTWVQFPSPLRWLKCLRVRYFSPFSLAA